MPKDESCACETGPDRTDTPDTFVARYKARTQCIARHVGFVKKIAYFFVPWEPFPEFRDPKSPEWQLMEAIIRRFKQSAGDRPIVIVADLL